MHKMKPTDGCEEVKRTRFPGDFQGGDLVSTPDDPVWDQEIRVETACVWPQPSLAGFPLWPLPPQSNPFLTCRDWVRSGKVLVCVSLPCWSHGIAGRNCFSACKVENGQLLTEVKDQNLGVLGWKLAGRRAWQADLGEGGEGTRGQWENSPKSEPEPPRGVAGTGPCRWEADREWEVPGAARGASFRQGHW